MTHEEFTLYWKPARDTFGKGKNDENFKRHPSYFLAKAIGVDYPCPGHWDQLELTEDLKNKLLALVGPHRETMLRIYQIKREYHEQQKLAIKQKRRADLRQIKQDDRDAKGELGDDPSAIGSQDWD